MPLLFFLVYWPWVILWKETNLLNTLSNALCKCIRHVWTPKLPLIHHFFPPPCLPQFVSYISPLVQPKLPPPQLTQWLEDGPSVSARIFPSAVTNTALEWVPPLEKKTNKTETQACRKYHCVWNIKKKQTGYAFALIYKLKGDAARTETPFVLQFFHVHIHTSFS